MKIAHTLILFGAVSAMAAATEADAQNRMAGSGIRVTKEVGTTPSSGTIEVVSHGDVSMLTPFSLNAYANLTEANMASLMASGDSLEIRLGQLAQTKGTSLDVRSYGATLVRDHTAHLAKTMEIITDEGVGSVAPVNNPEGLRMRQMLTHLRRLPAGAAWDATFLRFQAEHHQHGIDILTMNIKNAHDDDMEDHIEETLESYARHRDAARNIGINLGMTF
jgi:putative membrane protein